MNMYQLGREHGQMIETLAQHSKRLESGESRLGKVETRVNLMLRSGIVGALWIGSTTGQLNHNEISAALASIIKRFLIGL